jgi:hypothetical protein
MKGTIRCLVAAACSLLVGSAAAMGANASFQVSIDIRRAPERCTSATRNAASHAEVQVLCARDQFVAIQPAPGKPFLGTHGAAFRYMLDAGGVVPSDLLLKADLSGTVTSLRVYNASAEQGPLELLVSF